MLPLLSQQEAKEFDEWLMSPSGGAYTLQQLMELAGLTVALTIEKYYPESKRILVVTGPGNNGGDGLVAARHLAIFNKVVTAYRPVLERKESAFFTSLIDQAKASGVTFIDTLTSDDIHPNNLVVDALFGFGFKGNLRAPFDECVTQIIESEIPIVSIDCPTGWTSDSCTQLQPQMLVSLTAPKECAKYFHGHLHILGGRFIPNNLPEKFKKLSVIRDLYKKSELFIDISMIE